MELRKLLHLPVHTSLSVFVVHFSPSPSAPTLSENEQNTQFNLQTHFIFNCYMFRPYWLSRSCLIQSSPQIHIFRYDHVLLFSLLSMGAITDLFSLLRFL